MTSGYRGDKVLHSYTVLTFLSSLSSLFLSSFFLSFFLCFLFFLLLLLQVNKLLSRATKAYVKTVACYPQLSSRLQYQNFLQLQDSEKVHVNLLAMEARFQSELLYALR